MSNSRLYTYNTESMVASILKSLSDILKWISTEKRPWVIGVTLLMIWASFTTYLVYDYRVKELETIDMVDVLRQDSKIEDLMEEFMYRVDADRCYVFQFHNGVNYYSGEHMHRMTNTYEAVRDGISEEKGNLTNLQIKDFRWFLEETVEGDLYIVDVNSIPDGATRAILMSQGIKSLAVAPIFVKGAFVGCVGVDYVFEKQDSFSDGYIYMLEQFSMRIAKELTNE